MDVPDVTGDRSADLTVTLYVDGSEVASKTVTVADGETTDVSFSHTFSETGSQDVRVEATVSFLGTDYSGDASTTVDVQPEPLGSPDLSVDAPDRATVGESVPMEATVSLPEAAGQDASGTVTVAAEVDGTAVATAEVTLSDGDSETVSLSPTFEATGEVTVTVQVSGTVAGTSISASESVTVTVEPGSVGDPEVSVDAPDEATVGESVPVEATVGLPEVSGTDRTAEVSVELRVDGETRTSETVTLGDGETTTVSLPTSFDRTGTVTVTVVASATVAGESVEASAERTIRIAVPDPPVDDVELSATVPETTEAGTATPIEATVELPEPSDGRSVSAEVTVDLAVDGETVASRTVTLDGGASRTVRFEPVLEASGETTVELTATARVADATLSASVERTVVVRRPNLTTLDGAAFPVPESLEDEVAAYRQQVGADEVPARAFVLAQRDSLYLVFTDKPRSELTEGIATVTGTRLSRNLSTTNFTFGVVAATDVSIDRRGQSVGVSEVSQSPGDYRLELVRVDATYRRLAVLTDPDAGADFTASTTTGILVENPRTAGGVARRVAERARRLVRQPRPARVDAELSDPRRPHLHTASLRTRLWTDAPATVDAIVLSPGSAARRFVETVDRTAVAHAERGEPLLYLVRADFDPREFDSVDDIKRRGAELDGEVVAVTARLYQGRLSVQETLEHAQGAPCSTEVLTIETPEGPVCVNVVPDVLLHGGAAWTTVPTAREDVLLVVGASSRHQDAPLRTRTGRYRIVGEVVSTSRIDESLPEGTALVAYRLNRTGSIDYQAVRGEARAIIENQSDRLVEGVRTAVRGNDSDGSDAGQNVPVSLRSIAANTPRTVRLDRVTRARTGLRQVTVETTTDVEAVSLRARRLPELPDAVQDPPTRPVRVLNISARNLSETATATVTLQLTVDASAVADGEQPVVYRYHEDTWTALETSVVSQSGGTLVVNATAPGLSYFIVGSVAEGESEPTPTATVTPTPTEEPTTDVGTQTADRATPTTPASDSESGDGSDESGDGGGLPLPGFGAGAAVVAIAVLATVASIARRRRR